MSLILDALRKSEAERRRGDLPALALELPPAPPGRRTAPTWWLAVPLVAAVAAMTFWLTRPTALPAPTLEPAGSPREETGVALEARPTEATGDQVEVGAGTAGEGFEQARDGLRPALAAGRGLMPANPSAAIPAPPPEATDVPPAEPSNQAPLLALADLTPDERRALPPLKLSMHLWSEDPTRRFVILDGHRLGEGDRAGSAVVERIDPTGVILAADGRRILLPLP